MISQVLKAINISFSKKLKLKYFFVFLFNVFSSLLEVLSVALVIPFTMFLFKKDELLQNQFIDNIYTYLNFTSYHSFVIFFSIVFLSLLIISNIFSIINVWLISYLTYQLDYNIVLRLFKNFLFLGYENKININSADLISKMTIQIKRFVEGVVNSLMIIFQKFILICFILIFLLYVNFKITIFSLVFLLILYLIFYKMMNNIIYRKGSEMTSIFNNRQRLISESIFGIKEIILYNLQDNLYNKLKLLSKKLTKNVAFVRTSAVAPRYFLEILIFLILIPASLYTFINKDNDLNDILPIVTAFIFALYKISPAVQAIFSAFVNIKTDLSAYDTFKKDIHLIEKSENKNSKLEFEKIYYKKKIYLKNVKFFYENDSSKIILDNIDIEIDKNKVTGIFGTSGSGKTSCLNIILGFLQPNSGQILIDDMEINLLNNDQWMKKIGYVSQFTFLFDDTLINNISMFEKSPDRKKVIESLYKAGLKEYYYKNNKNLDIIIGERGSKISGGEAQRIGLARALYREPEILILDEFTSSLDADTENEIIKNIDKIRENLTIILSSHKINVLKFCDKLYEINSGKIKTKSI